MVTIQKTFDFDAAHQLPNVPAGHKCGRLHGHTYRVEIRLSGVPDEKTGWFVDYADIARAWDPLSRQLDHHLLNEVVGLENPTTEVLVHWLFERLDRDSKVGHFLSAIRVYESSTTWCEINK